METGKKLRIRRLFREGRAIIVPMDHAIYFGPVPGLEDPAALVARMAAGGADGLLVTPGVLGMVADSLGGMGVILRLDGTVSRVGNHLERTRLISSVEEAARLGVEAVVLNVYVGTENEDFLLAKLGEVASKCREYGVVLVGEMIPSNLLTAHYGIDVRPFEAEERAEYIAIAARVGAEIGADILKVNYSGTADSFRHVTKHALRPILMAGGVKMDSDKEFLEAARDALQAGAAGICAGRNLWARDDPGAMLAALHAVVHENKSVEEAMTRLGA